MYPLTPFLPSQSVNVLSSARMRRCSASVVWEDASPPRTRRDPGTDSAAAPSTAPRTNRRRDILFSNRLSATLAFLLHAGCVSIRPGYGEPLQIIFCQFQPRASAAGGVRFLKNLDPLSRRFGAQPSPYPPPPGVLTVTTSPSSSSRLVLGGSSSPFRRFWPTAPGSPPSMPCGGWRLRSVRRERLAGSSTRTERTMPSPPRCLPFPPEP